MWLRPIHDPRSVFKASTAPSNSTGKAFAFRQVGSWIDFHRHGRGVFHGHELDLFRCRNDLDDFFFSEIESDGSVCEADQGEVNEKSVGAFKGVHNSGCRNRCDAGTDPVTEQQAGTDRNHVRAVEQIVCAGHGHRIDRKRQAAKYSRRRQQPGP